MRVGIITSSYPVEPSDSRNAGVFVRDFALRLASRGVDVTIMTPQPVVVVDPGIEVIPFGTTTNEASLTHLRTRGPLALWRMGRLMLSGVVTVLSQSRSKRFDSVLAMWAIPSGVFALVNRLVFGTPYSVWALGSDIWRAGDYPAGHWILQRVLRSARARYADGTELAHEVERIAGLGCSFLASSRDLPAPAYLLGLDRSFIHFLCVARFHPHKGVDVLIEAVARVPESQRAAMRVHVFGGGPQEQQLRTLVEVHRLGGTVAIGGFLNPGQLAGYLHAVDWVVVPSRIESIPLVLSDAAQTGRAVIVTDVGDMGHLVRSHGAGLVVPPEDPDGLAAAILEALSASSDHAAGAQALARALGLDASVDRFLDDVG